MASLSMRPTFGAVLLKLKLTDTERRKAFIFRNAEIAKGFSSTV
jgi:hypothetical protein